MMIIPTPVPGRVPQKAPERRARHYKRAALLLLPVIFVVSLCGVLFANHGVPKVTTSARSSLNKKLYSTSDPTSPWVVVNKHQPLNPKNYAPEVTVPDVPLRLGSDSGEMQVATKMAPALEQLFKAASKANLNLMLASGYRSFTLQTEVYNAEVANNGREGADRESARPGYSEHQTGLAADIEPTSRECEVDPCFGQLPEGKWLAANAETYGFIIRYPQNKESVTGYVYEPWHIRYVGIPLAQELKNKHVDTLEAFFGLGAAPDYN